METDEGKYQFINILLRHSHCQISLSIGLYYVLTIKRYDDYRSGGRIEKPGRGKGRGARGGRGGGRGRGKKEPAPSAEDLDKELDTYLKAR